MAGSSGEADGPSVGPALSVDPEAEADIQEARDWYEARSPGLGFEFVRAVDACLATIERFPHGYPVVCKGVRRALLRRFPYGIFYLIEGERVSVIACTHGSRHPRTWQRRVRWRPTR